MNFPVIPLSAQLASLLGLIDTFYPGTPDNAKIHLYKNDVYPDENSTLDTFTEADYAEYAALPVTMSSPTMNDQGMIITLSNLINWASNSGDEVQQVYGVYITDKDATVLIAAQRFDGTQILGGSIPQSVSGIWRQSFPPSSIGWLSVE